MPTNSGVYTVSMPKAPKINIMIYGAPGVGKTRFAAGSCYHPAMRTVLFLNIEGGLISVADADIPEEFRPLAIDIHTLPELEAVFWRLTNKATDPEFSDVRTVVIDSASELVTIDLEAVVARKIQNSKDKHENLDIVQLADHGEVGRRVARVLRWFRDLPLNVVYTAHPRFIYPRDRKGQQLSDTPSEVFPSFPDRLRSHLTGYLDLIFYMYADEHGNRWLLTQPMGPFFAKVRGENFARALGSRVLVPPGVPTLALIYKMLGTRGELPELLRPEQAVDAGQTDTAITTP